VNGDPTLATQEKGRIIFDAVVHNFVRMAREFKNRPRGERVDYHGSSGRAETSARQGINENNRCRKLCTYGCASPPSMRLLAG